MKGEQSGITPEKKLILRTNQTSQLSTLNSTNASKSSIDDRLRLGPVILSTRSNFDWSSSKSDNSF